MPAARRERNASRTRRAVLDAAEQLFAARGYDATRLSDVGSAAGVSRGTPGYFFGSKAGLYRAVLDRTFDEVRAAVQTGRERARASGKPADEVLAGAVGDYFDFLTSHPRFVRLIERAALDRDRADPARNGAGFRTGQEALLAIAGELGLDDSRSGPAAQLLFSIISLCWFSVVHAGTVAPAVGVDLSTPRHRERRKQHVVALVRDGIRGLGGQAAPAPSPSRQRGLA